MTNVIKSREERRATLAPCDNIGEIASPVVILVAIGLEGLIDALPIERAPYLADANDGILGAWRAQRFRGEAPIMMAVALAVRVISCWVELTIRARMRHGSNDDAGNNLGSSDGNADVSGDGERVAAMGSNAGARRLRCCTTASSVLRKLPLQCST